VATLRWLNPGVYIRKAQLDIIDFFNIPDALKQRGFQEVTEAPLSATLITPEAHSCLDTGTREGQLAAIRFLDRFNSKECRTRARKMIFQGEQSVPPDEFQFTKTSENELRYAKTFELLLAYQCIKNLKAFSASFGVHISGAPEGGDYDCIANFQTLLFYIEVKSGNAINIGEERFEFFLARHEFLQPELSIFLLDTQGVPDDVVLRFRGLTISGSKKVQRIVKWQRQSETLFTINQNILVVDISKTGDILTNIRSALRWFWSFNTAVRSQMYNLVQPGDLGFTGSVLCND